MAGLLHTPQSPGVPSDLSATGFMSTSAPQLARPRPVASSESFQSKARSLFLPDFPRLNTLYGLVTKQVPSKFWNAGLSWTGAVVIVNIPSFHCRSHCQFGKFPRRFIIGASSFTLMSCVNTVTLLIFVQPIPAGPWLIYSKKTVIWEKVPRHTQFWQILGYSETLTQLSNKNGKKIWGPERSQGNGFMCDLRTQASGRVASENLHEPSSEKRPRAMSSAWLSKAPSSPQHPQKSKCVE